MITDYLMYFSDKQVLSAAKESDFTLDFHQAAPTTGMFPQPLYVVTVVGKDITGKMTVEIETSDQETTGFKSIAKSEEYDAPKAGTQVIMRMPRHHKRYLRVKYTGSPSGSGTVTSFVTTGVDDNVPPIMHTGA